MTSEEIRVYLDTLGHLLIQKNDPKINILKTLEDAVKTFLYLPSEQDLAKKLVTEVYQCLPTSAYEFRVGSHGILKQMYSQATISSLAYKQNPFFSGVKK